MNEKHIAHLEAALKRSGQGYAISDVLDKIAAGQARFVPGAHSAAVLEQEFCCNIWLAGGDLKELLEMERVAALEAKASGFTCMAVTDARKGWDRVLIQAGYRPEHRMVKVF